MQKASFDKMVQECLEQALSETFGEESAKIVQYYVGKSFGVTITKREEFSEALHELLGYGAQVVERKILGKLYLELGLRLKEKEGYTFTQYIEEAKRRHEGSKRIKPPDASA